MNQQKNVFAQIIKYIEKILTWLCNILMITLVIAVGIQVVCRYVFNNPTSWSEILAQYSFVWMSLFGAVLVFRENGLLYVDTVQNTLKGPLLKLSKFICYAIGMFVSAAWCYSGIMQMINVQGVYSWGIVIPMAYVYMAVPISFFFLFCFMLAEMMKLFFKSNRICSLSPCLMVHSHITITFHPIWIAVRY